MGVKFVIQPPEDRDGENDKGRARFSRTFRVFTNSRDDGPAVVMGDSRVPQVGSPYVYRNEVYPFAVVSRVFPRHNAQTADGDVWDVDVEYANDFDPQGKDQRDPLQERPSIVWSQSQRTVPWIFKKDGTLVVNTAGDPFDPALTIEVFDSVLTVERWETAYDDARAESFRGKLNSGPFRGREKRCARVMQIGGRRDWFWGLLVYRVSYQIEFRAKLPGQEQGGGWDEEVIDQGFRRKVLDADGREHLENIVDESGNPIAQPAFLDGFGRKLQLPNDPNRILMEKYDEIDFGSLNLENI